MGEHIGVGVAMKSVRVEWALRSLKAAFTPKDLHVRIEPVMLGAA